MNVFLLLLGDDESQPMEIEDPSDDAASESDNAASESDEGKGLGFDLNELPPNEEEWCMIDLTNMLLVQLLMFFVFVGYFMDFGFEY